MDPDRAIPKGCIPVLEGAATLVSQAALTAASMKDGEEGIRFPVVLRQAAACPDSFSFTASTLCAAAGHLWLPAKTVSDSGNNGGCFIGDQGRKSVMAGEVKSWHPNHMSFGEFIEEKVLKNSPLYLRLCSGRNACSRNTKASDGLVYTPPDDPEICELVCSLLDIVPIPRILPYGRDFSVIFWMGSEGGNFGLHTDFFSEQYLLQSQGWKEVYLLMPDDARVMQPMGLETGRSHKSSLRSVDRMNEEQLKAAGCHWVLLAPGDLLFIPEFWWHELRIVSKGPSLTTTFRQYLSDNKYFFSAIRRLQELHDTFSDEEDESWCPAQSAGLMDVLAEGVWKDICKENAVEENAAHEEEAKIVKDCSSSSSVTPAKQDEQKGTAASA